MVSSFRPGDEARAGGDGSPYTSTGRAATSASSPAMADRSRPCPSPDATLVADLQGGAQLAEHGDGGEIRELARARILRGYVLDLHREAPELPFHDDAMLIAHLPGDGIDPDAGLLRSDAGQRDRGDHIDIGGEGFDRLRGGPLEDQRFLRDGVEVDFLLLDPRRPGKAAGRRSEERRVGKECRSRW